MWSAVDDFEGEGIGALGEFEGNGGHGGCGAVLDGQGDLVSVTAEIEVGVAPGVELGRAAQGLAGADVAGAFPGMVDDGDSEAVAALQLAQEGEQRRHFAADVLVDAMQADEGIEDKQARLQPGDGLVEADPIGLEIETQCRRGDHLDIEIGEGQTGGGADPVEPPADDVEGVFGGVEQDASGLGHGEAAQAARTGGDGHGEIEGEEGFAAFWLAADDADGLLGP